MQTAALTTKLQIHVSLWCNETGILFYTASVRRLENTHLFAQRELWLGVQGILLGCRRYRIEFPWDRKKCNLDLLLQVYMLQPLDY